MTKLTESSRAQFEASLARLDAMERYASFALGAPDDGGWFALESVTEPEQIAHLVAQTLGQAEAGTSEMIAGNYLFRYLISSPLQAAGYLYAAESCVPALAGNVLLRDFEWLQHLRFRDAEVVAAEPKGEHSAALANALFAEVERAFGPLMAEFRARKYVAIANAWGSMLDALLQGFLSAGEDGLGADRAWQLWEDATQDRQFPLRRRPRRFSCQVEGRRHERAVRAGCCLWFMVPSEARQQDYCGSCYLMTDEERHRVVALHAE